MKFNWNSNIFIQENEFENVISSCEMVSIFRQPQCVKINFHFCFICLVAESESDVQPGLRLYDILAIHVFFTSYSHASPSHKWTPEKHLAILYAFRWHHGDYYWGVPSCWMDVDVVMVSGARFYKKITLTCWGWGKIAANFLMTVWNAFLKWKCMNFDWNCN